MCFVSCLFLLCYLLFYCAYLYKKAENLNIFKVFSGSLPTFSRKQQRFAESNFSRRRAEKPYSEQQKNFTGSLYHALSANARIFLPPLSVCDVKHGKKTLKCILTIKAGIDQIASFILPFGKPTVVKCLFCIFDDKRHDPIVQAFLQGDQAPDSAVAVLKRMDALKIVVEGNDILDQHYAPFPMLRVVYTKRQLKTLRMKRG